MGIINILALGPPGTGKTRSIINLSNYYKQSNFYSYESEIDYVNYATLTPYEFRLEKKLSTTIKIFEFAGQTHFKQLKGVLRNLKIHFHGLLLFFDGLGFYLSTETIMTYLKEIFPILKISKNLLIGLIGTKYDLRTIIQDKFLIENLKFILTKDLTQNREDYYLSRIDSKYKKFSLTTYQDKLTWFNFSQVEQLLVNLMERRILFIPKYKPLSSSLLRYFSRNLLGTALLKDFEFSKNKRTVFLTQIFKSAPTALENDSNIEILPFEYLQWQEGVIPSIWQLPINIDYLRNNFDQLFELQVSTNNKLVKISENISLLVSKYLEEFDIDLFNITSTSKSEKDIFKRFIDNIVILNENKSKTEKKKKILSWKSLGLEKF